MEIRLRSVTLDRSVDTQGQAQALECLRAQAGVHSVSLKGDRRLCIEYDLLETSMGALCQALAQSGVALTDSVGARLRRWWQAYLDQNAADMLKASNSPCCSNPEEIYAASRKGQPRK